MRRGVGSLAVMAALSGLLGCAIQPPPTPVPRTPPPGAAVSPPSRPADATHGTRVGTTASGGTITVHDPAGPTPTVIDSTPSIEALAVLRTIPEPLGGEAQPDTAQVPVPSPTRPLGDRPGWHASAVLPESLAAPITPPAAAPAPASLAPPRPTVSSGAPAPGDPCWRVQVAASPEPEHAARLAEAARSQLVAAFVVEREGGLSKVRTRGCLSGTAASELRQRAVASGFDGAFRFPGKRP